MSITLHYCEWTTIGDMVDAVGGEIVKDGQTTFLYG